MECHFTNLDDVGWNPNVTTEVLRAVSSLKALPCLDLLGCHDVTDEGLRTCILNPELATQAPLSESDGSPTSHSQQTHREVVAVVPPTHTRRT